MQARDRVLAAPQYHTACFLLTFAAQVPDVGSSARKGLVFEVGAESESGHARNERAGYKHWKLDFFPLAVNALRPVSS